MAEILVRNLNQVILERLKKRARKEGRSLQSEVKAILQKAAGEPVVDIKTARALVEKIRGKFKGRRFPESVELIRQDRSR